jgi:hypothetical protein
MPVYLQIILITIGMIVFYFLAMFVTGLGIRKLCFRIISHMEDQDAFSASRAINVQDKRGNFFKMGMLNYRPKALQMLVADGVVVKTGNGKYYLNKDKLATIKKSAAS